MARTRSQTKLQLCKRIQQEFGEKLRAAREDRGLLQKNLAPKMGLTRTSISNIERGTQRLYLDQVFEAAYALDMEASELLPPVAAVYSPGALRVASDDPLTKAASDEAVRIAGDLAVPGSAKRLALSSRSKRRR